MTPPNKHLWMHQKPFKTKADLAVSRSGLRSAHEPVANTVSQDLPHTSMVADPLGQQVNADLDYGNFKLSNGYELIKNGLEPQTAAELENLMHAREDQGVNPVVDQPVAPALQTQPQAQTFMANRVLPQSPMETVPGGMGFQPFGMPKPPGG